MRVPLLIVALLTGAVAFHVGVRRLQAADYFVAPSGSDAAPGTLERPFATLQRAQQAARQARGREPVTVFLREGVHYLPETLVFTAEDSGTQAAPVAYRAYRNEQAVISGGVRLKDLKWEPYRDGIMKAAVPAGFTSDQLFVNGQRQPMARYPNFDPNVRHFNGYAADAISPERAARWQDPRGGFIHAMHASEYQSTPDFKTIPLAPPAAALAAKIVAGKPGTMNEPVSVLTDGRLARNYGPVFGNGVVDGAFGYFMGEALDEQVLLIKFATGGQSLYVNFCPPSAGMPQGVKPEDVGGAYRALVAYVHDALDNLKKRFPGYDEKAGYQIVGFVWFQGYNDLFN